MATTHVLFVCLHGSAKSVIAAAWLERLARERGMEVSSTSAGIEPDDVLPPHVIEGLRDDGFETQGVTPRKATAAQVAAAPTVVSFGCALPGSRSANEIWSEIPQVSDGYQTARDAIVRRLHAFLDQRQLAKGTGTH